MIGVVVFTVFDIFGTFDTFDIIAGCWILNAYYASSYRKFFDQGSIYKNHLQLRKYHSINHQNTTLDDQVRTEVRTDISNRFFEPNLSFD